MKKRLSRDKVVFFFFFKHPGSPEQGNNLEENSVDLSISKIKTKVKVQQLIVRNDSVSDL